MSLWSKIALLITLPFIFFIWWGFLSFGTGIGFGNYQEQWEYRRAHPELIPPPDLIRIFDMGHTTSYASMEWLSLIQYIGDNIYDNAFLSFSHTLLEHISILHPYFTKVYELDLILIPFSSGENDTPEKKIKNTAYITQAILLGEKWIERLCDSEKIKKIRSTQVSELPWNNATLQDPCPSGMLPYYLAFAYSQPGQEKMKASEYYKIASMNHDGPLASRTLSILALSWEGDHLASALSFALVGVNGYDQDPYMCHTLGNTIAKDIIWRRKVDTNWINELQKEELSLKNTKDPKNPISQSSNNCYDMVVRSIESVYLSYISEKTQNTTAKTGDDIIRLGILGEIPTLSSKVWYTVRQKDGIWVYRAK
jgi:hypothetical protein